MIPVALVFRQDDVSGGNISEEPDWGLLPARLPVFIQRMVVIVHLVRNEHLFLELNAHQSET